MPLVDLAAKEAMKRAGNRIVPWPASGTPNKTETISEPATTPKVAGRPPSGQSGASKSSSRKAVA